MRLPDLTIPEYHLFVDLQHIIVQYYKLGNDSHVSILITIYHLSHAYKL